MNTTQNTRAFIEAEQYSSFILMNLESGLLGEAFYRDVADFGSGTTLHVKVAGDVTITDAIEDTPVAYSPIETGEVTMHITESKASAWYITDELREDGAQVDALAVQHSLGAIRQFQKSFESDFLAIAAKYYDVADADTSADYVINGFSHALKGSGAGNAFALNDLLKMKLAFDKADVPSMGRIFICDAVVEYTLLANLQITSDVTGGALGFIKEGLANGMRFSTSLFGFDVMVSSHVFVSETWNAGDAINVAMCVLDDNTKPIMGAWRRKPRVEGEREINPPRDKFTATCRYGFGIQRVDTMGAILTKATI